MYSNLDLILGPRLARAHFKAVVWPNLGLKGRWAFERAFKKWIIKFYD